MDLTIKNINFFSDVLYLFSLHLQVGFGRHSHLNNLLKTLLVLLFDLEDFLLGILRDLFHSLVVISLHGGYFILKLLDLSLLVFNADLMFFRSVSYHGLMLQDYFILLLVECADIFDSVVVPATKNVGHSTAIRLIIPSSLPAPWQESRRELRRV